MFFGGKTQWQYFVEATRSRKKSGEI